LTQQEKRINVLIKMLQEAKEIQQKNKADAKILADMKFQTKIAQNKSPTSKTRKITTIYTSG